MTHNTTLNLILQRHLDISTIYGRAVMAIMIVLGSILIAISAHIQIPFWPVPVTMQSFTVLTLCMLYGWKLGGVTILLYLFEGAIGLPVFASGAGLAYLAGPTAGYLLGFLIGGVIVGYLAQKGWDQSFIKTCLTNTLGTSIIFGFGYLWLGYFYMMAGHEFMAAFSMAFFSGVWPFMVGAIAKILLASLVIPKAKKFLR